MPSTGNLNRVRANVPYRSTHEPRVRLLLVYAFPLICLTTCCLVWWAEA